MPTNYRAAHLDVERKDNAKLDAAELEATLADRAGFVTPPRMVTVTIPGSDQHDGHHSVRVTLAWVCPQCGGPRGEPFYGISYDGSRQLAVHRWINPCGHIDLYRGARREAGLDA